MLELLVHIERLAIHVKYVVGSKNVGNGYFIAFCSKNLGYLHQVFVCICPHDIKQVSTQEDFDQNEENKTLHIFRLLHVLKG